MNDVVKKLETPGRSRLNRKSAPRKVLAFINQERPFPTNRLTILEPINPSIRVSELHKMLLIA